MRRFRDSLTTRGAAFLASGIVLVLAGLALGQHDLSRIGTALGALPILSGLLGRRHDLDLVVDREAQPSRVTIDQPAVVQMTLSNPSTTRSPMLFAEEHLDYSLGDRPRFVLPSLAAGGSTHVEYAVRAHARGAHRLGPLGVRVQDPFGLTLRHASVSTHDELLVLPRVVALADGRALGRGLGSEGSVPHRVALHGEDDQSIREYRDGDDLRRIHWPATARTGELMVRQEDRPAKRRAVVLLDTRAQAHGGKGPSGSLEWAVTMAASALAHLLEMGFAVHLLTPDGESESGVREDTDLDRGLETLARTVHSEDKGIGSLLHAASAATAQGGLVVAIVGAVDDDASRALASLRQPGGPGLAFVINAASFGGRTATPTAASSGAPGAAPGGDVGPPATTASLAGAGWSVLSVDPQLGVADAWAAAAGSRSLVGAR
ncbi:DUF58 domain-containing protein [Knoellia subterranea]|uniref:DUF58 domain-containing protein n=1 Tax=Knoellia subterranea KCTC 19937 TaxID=1385521 RepID=A0A0A0JGM7_9MICO|nr:DUF58 domain-containing protein [Knoellia subterranea]KGN36303.1 hypothetical protein N803_05735 [Knoellia subterranea KCTC 19937]